MPIVVIPCVKVVQLHVVVAMTIVVTHAWTKLVTSAPTIFVKDVKLLVKIATKSSVVNVMITHASIAELKCVVRANANTIVYYRR